MRYTEGLEYGVEAAARRAARDEAEADARLTARMADIVRKPRESWKEGCEPNWKEIQRSWAWAYEHNFVYGSTREVVSDYRTYNRINYETFLKYEEGK